MSVTFRDESNESSSTLTGYSDATVTAPNQTRPKEEKQNTNICDRRVVTGLPGAGFYDPIGHRHKSYSQS